MFDVAEQKKKRRAPVNKVLRHNWSPEEKAEIKKLFAKSIKDLVCSKKPLVLEAMDLSKKNGGLIHEQPMRNIMKQVFNVIDKIRKGKK